MSRTAWVLIAAVCPILGLAARDIITRGRPSYFTTAILLSPLAFWMWKRNRQQAIHALLFLGIWAGLIGVALMVEWRINSTPMHGGGGMPALPVAFLAALYLGWIPAAVVTIALAIRRARMNSQTRQRDQRGGSN